MQEVIRVENGKYLTGQGGSGGSGGHTIQNDSGTALPQESALQFVGVYSEDDSTNGKTKVNIVREMTKAQMDALSTDAKKGVIHTTDEPDNPANPISADDVTYGSETVKDALDEIKGKITDMPSITPITGVTAEVKNGILFVDLVSITPSSTGWVDVATLPEGYRPSKPCYATCVAPTDSSSGLLYIGVAGNIQIRGNSSTSKGYTGNICVPII